MREYQVFSGLVVEPKNLGRRISRRLSLVARVPTFIQSKFRPTDPDAGDSSGNIRKWPQQLRKARPISVHIILPNGAERTITAPGKCTVRQLIQPVALELHICEFRLRASDTLALLSLHAEASLIDGDTIILEDATRVRDERGEVDARFRLTEDLLDTEREFLVSFRTIYDVYARPLKKLCSISEDEQKQLFGGVEPILSVSNMLLTKLEDALASWDPMETRIGTLFSKQFWAQFEEYYHFFTHAKELLREKQYRDEEFVEICKLRQGAALHTLDSLLELPIQRLASYERYFQDLLCETNADHPDLEEVHKARDKAHELVKRCEEEINQLDRVQNLFPNDQLYLHDKDALSVKMKGLIRKRSTTAARLQRAFSSKGLRNPSANASSPSSSSDMTDSSNSVPTSAHSTPVKTSVDKRQFIMETAVQFINGLQSQDRHLFLFNDLLLIAKARSGGNFKLKDKVRISELWLATCVDEIAEVSKSRDTSFVIGWPTTNVVATFSSAALRDLWWNKLGQVIQEEREKEPKSTIIQISYHDAVHCIGYSKTLSISSTDTVRDCIKLVLSHLEMSNLDANGFRLWVKTAADESPYPLIGHEFPFAIKMNCLREFISNEEGFDLDHCNNIYNVDPATRCQFILKSVQKPNFGITSSNGVGGGKSYSKNNKGKKSPTRIQKVFRRVQSKPDSLEMIGSAAAGAFFAQPLSKICPGDKLPQPLIDMLLELRSKGPQTVGIFRKSANARQVREIRERIDGGEGIDWSTVNAVVTAVVFKDFLRSLPDSLLGSALYDQWLQVATMDSIEIALDKIKSLCDRLPSANLCLLRHFLCVLVHIANNSSQNMMSASNLAVCVGPSLLWANCTANSAVNPAMALSAEATASKQVPALVAILIDKCTLLFGTETVNLLGDSSNNGSKAAVASTAQNAPVSERRVTHKDYRSKAPVQKHMARHGLLQHDSGNEESDSLHSLHHMDVMRRDDSSIDSLERELLGDPEAFDGDHAIHLRRDKMSVTNLSRDSGLTLSDTQLYTPDEDIGSESSSSGRGSDRDKSRNIRDVMRPRVNHTPNRAEQTRSMYVPTHTKSASRLDAHSQHGKVIATYSTATNYTPVYDHRQDIYRKLSDDAVYAVPKATPTVILGEEYQEPSNPNFQRQDWFRRKSHSKKQSGSVKFESPPMGLRRSASDESLANHNVPAPMTVESQNKKPASHRKGRAPPPPSASESRRVDSAELSRSKSDANLDVPDALTGSKMSVGKDVVDYRTSVPVNTSGSSKLSNGHARSQSTPHIDEVDRSYDSSTLSDDDSTPHVSRSNSRGKDYRAVNSAWETAYGALSVPVPAPIHIIVSQDGSGSIVYPAVNRSANDAKSTPSSSAKKSEHESDRYGDDYTRKNTRKSSDKAIDLDESVYRTPVASSGRSKDMPVESSASARSRKNESGRRTEVESGRTDERASDRSRVSSSTPSRVAAAESSHGGSDRYAKSSEHSASERIYEKHHQRSRDERRSTSHQHPHPSSNHSSRSPIYGTPHSGRFADYDTVLHSGNRSHERFVDDGSAASTQSSSRHGTPDIPTYEEALIRRRMPQNWTTWKDNSSNLLQVRASPIRLSSQGQDSWNDADQSMTSIPPPLPPKSDPPPLPPKQRIHLRTNPYVSPVKMRQASAAVNRTRPVTIHMDASILGISAVDSPPPSLPKKERSPNRRRGSNVSVVAIENNYTPLHRSFAFSTHNLRHQMENAHKEDWVKEEQDALGFKMRDQEIQTSGHWAPYFCEIETQTSLSPQPSISSDDAKSDIGLCRSEGTNTDSHVISTPVTARSERRTDSTPHTGGRSDKSNGRGESNGTRYEKNNRVANDVSSAPTKMRAERPRKEAKRSDAAVETDRRGRDRTREGSASTLQRSQSLPPLEKTSSDDSESESAGSASSDGEEETRTAITPTSQALRRAEISWSVSQLRALFSGSSPSSVPPPYRSPPAHLSCPTPSSRKRAESTDSYGEESYV